MPYPSCTYSHVNHLHRHSTNLHIHSHHLKHSDFFSYFHTRCHLTKQQRSRTPAFDKKSQKIRDVFFSESVPEGHVNTDWCVSAGWQTPPWHVIQSGYFAAQNSPKQFTHRLCFCHSSSAQESQIEKERERARERDGEKMDKDIQYISIQMFMHVHFQKVSKMIRELCNISEKGSMKSLPASQLWSSYSTYFAAWCGGKCETAYAVDWNDYVTVQTKTETHTNTHRFSTSLGGLMVKHVSANWSQWEHSGFFTLAVC